MAVVVLVLALAEVALAVGSWGVSALLPDVGVRSLLSGEGIRWFFGHFTESLAQPLLVWLVVVSSAVGCTHDSGIVGALRAIGRNSFRERMALLFAAAILLFFVVLIALLVLSPHAILLSATGRVVPSPFSVAVVPVAAFLAVLSSMVYGVASGRYLSLKAVFHSLFLGIERAAPLFIVYIVVIQLYYSLIFVFG